MTRFDPLHPLPCVYFKHGAYWYVKRGKWQRIAATLEDALAWYARNVHAPADGRLSGLLETALAHHLKTVRLAASTKRQYRKTADVLKRRLRLFDPGTLRPKHVAQLKADMASKPNMANRYLSLLRTLCAYLVEWGEIDANPVDQRAQSLTEAKRQGKNPTALAGHSTPAMTERYLRDRETPVVSGPALRNRG